MSGTESLRLTLDNANARIQELEVENRKLREGNPQQASELDKDQELDHLKELYEQALRDLQDRQTELEESKRQLDELRARETELPKIEEELRLEKEEYAKLQEKYEGGQEDLARQRTEYELEKYRTLENERQKWETREARLLQQITDLQQPRGIGVNGGTNTGSGEVTSVDSHTPPTHTETTVNTVNPVVDTSAVPYVPVAIETPMSGSIASHTGARTSSSLSPIIQPHTPSSPALVTATTSHAPVDHSTSVPSPMEALLMAQQIPPISKFSGDERSGEPQDFVEWIEQFELVASAFNWSEQAKLVNLTTRLKGQAYSFYRACTPDQRAKYTPLVDALKGRFTPVNIQAVQSSLFHDRRQGAQESVDSYAQELKRLFYKAYPKTLQAGQATEEMGQSVLSSQFVTGLQRDIKVKLAGQEGSIDQLLVKARFEEAKLRDLGAASYRQAEKGKTSQSVHQSKEGEIPVTQTRDNRNWNNRERRNKQRGVCNECGSNNHYYRQCPMRKVVSREATRQNNGKVAGITSTRTAHPTTESTIEEQLPYNKETPQTSETTNWQDRVVRDTLEESLVTLHGITSSTEETKGIMGPTHITTVEVEGHPAKTLIDTGSPVTIVSLQFLISTLVGNLQTTEQNKDVIRELVEKRLMPTQFCLRSYSGAKLPIVKQTQVQLKRGPFNVSAVIQVQDNAPVELLLGTDLQPQLGFHLLDEVHSQQPVTSQDPTVTPNVLSSLPEELAPSSEDPTKAPTETPPDPGVVGSVCLLQAIRIPGRHTRIVAAQADCDPNVCQSSATIFHPHTRLTEITGLVLEEALVDLDSTLAVSITNPQHHPIQLQEGLPLGRLETTEWVKEVELELECLSQGSSDDCVCGAVVDGQDEATTRRVRELLEKLHPDQWNLDEKQKYQMETLVAKYHDTFALDQSELGQAHRVTHNIDTDDHEPIKQHPRRVPFALRGKVEDMIHDMLKSNVIKPSQSPWASPIVLVAKKDGSTRFCVDYRKLNTVTKKDVYPLPRIDDTLDLLATNKFFSTLDLASGYWQIAMEETSKEKTAFTTHVGLYEFEVMPFGLCNAPATFQRLMENILHSLIGKSCLVYLDDVLVLGRTLEEHAENLEAVLSRIRAAGLKLKPSKCNLARKEVEYLGYCVSAKGVATDPKKVTAIKAFPVPLDVRSLRSFLGLLSYYRRFIPNFSIIANPLFVLTRKDVPFQWTTECQESFDNLKDILTSATILAFPDFKEDFLLETDASGTGLGAVLSQKQPNGQIRPIAYASRTLQSHEKNYGSTELEGLAVVWAVKHFRQYLYGHRCHVFTDHEALKALLNTPHPSGRLARWGLVIQELDLTINYQPGRKNMKADALSRNPVETREPVEHEEAPKVVAIVDGQIAQAGEPHTSDSTSARQCKDPELSPILLFLKEGTLPEDAHSKKQLVAEKSNYTLVDETLFRVAPDGSLRFIPPVDDRQKLFNSVHAGKFAGHLREAKIYSTLAKHYWWPRMRTDVNTWCKSCLTCATRRVGQAIKPELMPIPVGGPFDRVGVDILQLPKSSRGHQYAVVFVDYLTKWPEVFPARDQSALTVAKLLVERVICRHGVPAELLSDRGANFLSGLLQEMYMLLGIKKTNTTAYHPQTDGLVERFNRTLLDMLAKTTDGTGRDWDIQLPYVLFAYRSSVHPSTGESPFYLMHGRDPRLPTEEAMSPPVQRYPVDATDYKTEMTTRMAAAWELARSQVKKAQNKQKEYYDRHATPQNIAKGERVFVYMPAAKSGPAWKLARPYHGPYRVVKAMEGGVEVVPVDRPQDIPIRVSAQRIRRCPAELNDQFYPRRAPSSVQQQAPAVTPNQADWTLRLRPRGRGRPSPQAGEM